MHDPKVGDRVEVASEAELWEWLGANHGREGGVWLLTWKAARRDRFVGRDAVLDALIAHGWIDGRRMKLDEKRTMQWIAPRRQQAWARSYKQRAERLEAEGRMRPPGQRAVDAGQASGLWNASEPVDDLLVPNDLSTALSARGAVDWFENTAPSYRRNVLRWIAGAKRDETRAKRIVIVVDHAVRGEKVPNY